MNDLSKLNNWAETVMSYEKMPLEQESLEATLLSTVHELKEFLDDREIIKMVAEELA